MAAPEIIYKDPDENPRIFTCSFVDKLASGSTLSSVNAVTAAPSGLTISSTSVVEAGLKISAQFTGGTAGTDYIVTWRGNASNGEILEESGTLRVRHTSE
jgi:hypothetical protein